MKLAEACGRRVGLKSTYLPSVQSSGPLREDGIRRDLPPGSERDPSCRQESNSRTELHAQSDGVGDPDRALSVSCHRMRRIARFEEISDPRESADPALLEDGTWLAKGFCRFRNTWVKIENRPCTNFSWHTSGESKWVGINDRAGSRESLGS